VSRNTGGIYWLVFFRSASRAIVSSAAACSASGDRAGCSLLSTPAVRATTLVARARRTWSASTTNATLSWGAMPSSFRTTMGIVTWPLLVTLAICWRAGIGLRIGNTLIAMIITLIASSLRSVNALGPKAKLPCQWAACACYTWAMSGFAEALAVARDLALVVLALLAIAQIGVLLVISLLLYRQLTPILKRTQEIMNNARGTSAFVSETVVRPIIRVAGVLAGVRGAASALGRRRGRQGG